MITPLNILSNRKAIINSDELYGGGGGGGRAYVVFVRFSLFDFVPFQKSTNNSLHIF